MYIIGIMYTYMSQCTQRLDDFSRNLFLVCRSSVNEIDDDRFRGFHRRTYAAIFLITQNILLRGETSGARACNNIIIVYSF